MIASFRIGRHSVTFCVAGAPRAQAERQTRSGCCKRGYGFGRKRAHRYFARFAWRSSPMPMPLTARRTSPSARSRKRFRLRAKPASDGLNLKSIACSVISLPIANPAQRRSRGERAIAVAREQGSRSFELRATTSLARVLSDQGRHVEADDRLLNIYRFFDAKCGADLADAKALLDELPSASRRRAL